MYVRRWFCAAAMVAAMLFSCGAMRSQTVQTTTVKGTVYQANGSPVSGTLQVSWPAFTTGSGQAVAAGRTSVGIGGDGKVRVVLAPNVGAIPAGLFYTAVYHLGDGTTSTEYWVVPNSIEATIGQVRSTVMPAAQAVQAVNKAYVDQSIAQAVSSQITPSGGTLTGPLYLAGDPTQAAQAANKHYVDAAAAQMLPIGGGALTGPVTAPRIGAVLQADQFAGADFGAQVQACVNALDPAFGGTCDARNFPGQVSMAGDLTLGVPNVTVYLPCSTIATSASIVVPAGTRNVSLHGCASRGTSAASGAQGGTVLLYSGSSALLQVGDGTFGADTKGFRMDNAALNTTAATASTARAMVFYRTQEISLAGLYVLGNANQAGLVLDGTGNYSGGSFEDMQFTGFKTAVSGIGHTVENAAATDWLNAATFVRMHIDCATQNGSPVAGTVGIDLQAGDGNTFTGGDVEGCATALHLGAHATGNTLVGVRNENSTVQVQADAGSSYNNWMTGGTMFTGKLVDNGTRNSFLDTFHRSFNELNGDWWGSQQDATVTNHFRLGIGTGSERGLLNRYQTDGGYRWTTGLSDASSGIQYYQVLDELNNVYRLSLGQYNQGQGSANNQTVLNAAGTGAVILNGSNNAGTGGVVFGSGGPASTTVGTVDKAGNAHFVGTLQTDGTMQSGGTMTVRNGADAEADFYLWPGATSSQKGSFTYKDFNGTSQWYMLKDQNNNWALNSAVGGLDSFKAYQATNSGDTYINASNATGHIRLNYEAGAGAETDIYSGGSAGLAAAFLGPTAIKFPGLAAGSARNCVQIDSSGYLSNTGAACGVAANVATAGLTFGDGSVQTTSQQGALTGAANDAAARTSASAAQLTADAALPANGCTTSAGGNLNCNTVAAGSMASMLLDKGGQVYDIRNYGAKCDGSTNDSAALAATKAAAGPTGTIYIPACTSVGVLTMDVAGQTLSIAKGGTLLAPNGFHGYALTIAADNVTVTGGGTIDGNRTTSSSACSDNACGSIKVNSGMSHVTITGMTIQNSRAYSIYAQDNPYFTFTNNYVTNAGFHSVEIQMSKPPVDGTDSIKGLVVSGNTVDTSTNSCPSKDGLQIFGYQDFSTGNIYWQDGAVITNNSTILRAGDSADITNITIASNVLTATTAAPHDFVVGKKVVFKDLAVNSFLNFQMVQITSVTPRGFTAAFTHSDMSAAETWGRAYSQGVCDQNPDPNATHADFGDRNEFSYLRGGTLSNNTVTNGRLGFSIVDSQGISVSGDSVTGINETGFEDVGNNGSNYSAIACSNGVGRCMSVNYSEAVGAGSKNIVVSGMTSKNMGMGINLSSATNVMLSNLQLDTSAPGFSLGQCIMANWSNQISISGLTCNGKPGATNYGVFSYNSTNISLSNVTINTAGTAAIGFSGDVKGTGGAPILFISHTDQGGTLAPDTTYYMKVASVCPSGTTIGLEGSFTTGARAANAEWFVAPTSCATSYQWWVGTTSGGESTCFTTTYPTLLQRTPAGSSCGPIPTTPTPTVTDNLSATNIHVASVPKVLDSRASGGQALGSNIRYHSAVNDQTGTKYPDVVDSTNNVTEQWHAGVPTGSIAANIGSIYHQTDATDGNSLWYKATGTGSSGWSPAGVQLSNPNFYNNADASQSLDLRGGVTAPQVVGINLRDYLGAKRFELSMDASYNFTVQDTVAAVPVVMKLTNGDTYLNSSGIRAVQFNRINNTGTGGVSFGSGGSGAREVAAVTGAGIARFPALLPYLTYSAAGTPLPACASSIKGEQATVSDATAPTYMGAYTSGGTITAEVICSYNGTTYAWLTH